MNICHEMGLNCFVVDVLRLACFVLRLACFVLWSVWSLESDNNTFWGPLGCKSAKKMKSAGWRGLQVGRFQADVGHVQGRDRVC